MLLFLILISLAIIMLSAVTTMPFIVSLLALSAVISKGYWVFIMAFFMGFVFDLFFLRILGQTSLFFIIFTFLIFAYQKKFEIQTVPFVFFAVFLGSAVYLWVFGYNQILIQSLMAALLTALLFRFLCHPERNEGSRFFGKASE